MADVEIKIPLLEAKTYSDSRLPVEKLYEAYLSLGKQPGFITKLILEHQFDESLFLPIIGILTKRKGPALWLISGIHGEEPAGPIAIAQNIKILKNLNSHKIPLVILPLCNPAGYYRNWRYLYSSQWLGKGKSIGESEHLLPQEKNPDKPRESKSRSYEAKKFTDWIIKKSKKYPPVLVIDLHEDNPKSIISNEDNEKDIKLSDSTYIYSQGAMGADDPIANEIIKILKRKKHPIITNPISETRFGEKIINGIVAAVKDGSIDELLASKKIIKNKKVIDGPSAKSVVVCETFAGNNISLEKRVEIHALVIKSLKKFWSIVTVEDMRPRLLVRVLPNFMTKILSRYIPHLR